MTPQEAFEAWWKEQGRRYGTSHLYQEAKCAWLAACTWQHAQTKARAVEIVQEWLSVDTMKLRIGELTAQEIRTVKAVVGALATRLAELAP